MQMEETAEPATVVVSDAVTSWSSSEYQALLKHFEEIYKLSATSLTVLFAGCGAVLAYGGVTTINTGISGLLVLLWYFLYFLPVRLYTARIVTRLSQIETNVRQPGHFVHWKGNLDGDRHGAKYGGTLPWHVAMVLVSIGTATSFYAAYNGYVGFAPPVEVVIEGTTGGAKVQLKASFRDVELKSGSEKLLAHARILGAVDAKSIPAAPR
jgi:hypothetical protein